MNKLTLGICLILFALNTNASGNAAKRPGFTQLANSKQSYLKQHIQRKVITDQQWSKQADEFIGLKRNAKVSSDTTKRTKSTQLPLGMLTGQDFQASISKI